MSDEEAKDTPPKGKLIIVCNREFAPEEQQEFIKKMAELGGVSPEEINVTFKSIPQMLKKLYPDPLKP